MYIKSIFTKDSKVLLQQLKANFSIIANSVICQPRLIAEIKVCQPTCRSENIDWFVDCWITFVDWWCLRVRSVVNLHYI